MNYKNIFYFNVKNSWKSITLLTFLAILPNFFGMINFQTPFGFKLHIFQYLIFLAAIIYGPIGGLISGAFGSFFTSISLNNPYILIGNIILGFFVGFFTRLKWNVILAVLTAYLIQLPWLYYSDIYLAHMPVKVVQGLILALFLSNTLWSVVTLLTYKPIKSLIK
jgi:uncharacterized membrane protein